MKVDDKVIWKDGERGWHKGKITELSRGIFSIQSDRVGVFNPILNILNRERYANLTSLDKDIKRIISL